MKRILMMVSVNTNANNCFIDTTPEYTSAKPINSLAPSQQISRMNSFE
jgi:hypothetical protein